MSWAGLSWAAGGYLAGTLPSTWLVARAKRAKDLISASGRSAGETDAHILMAKHLGVGWTALAATVDVLKRLVRGAVRRRGLHHHDPSPGGHRDRDPVRHHSRTGRRLPVRVRFQQPAGCGALVAVRRRRYAELIADRSDAASGSSAHPRARL